MPSTPHTAGALAALQARYTRVKAAQTTLEVVGARSASAAEAATAVDLALAASREAQAPPT